MKTISNVTRVSLISDLNNSGFSSSDIVDIFNAYAEEGKEVKRFSDRKTAVRRTIALIESLPEYVEPESVAPVEVAPEVEEKRSLSASIAKSWNNPEIAQKRLTRNGVIAYVGDKAIEFKSLRVAFSALALPDSKHIAFRQILKAEKEAVFTFGKTSVKFALIEE